MGDFDLKFKQSESVYHAIAPRVPGGRRSITSGHFCWGILIGNIIAETQAAAPDRAAGDDAAAGFDSTWPERAARGSQGRGSQGRGGQARRGQARGGQVRILRVDGTTANYTTRLNRPRRAADEESKFVLIFLE